MRVVRQPRMHLHGLSTHAVDRGPQAREPALINLPIPLNLPTIPVVGPILTNIIAGKPTTTSRAPTPTSTSTNGSGNGNQGGGNNGGSSDGNDQGNAGNGNGGNGGGNGGSGSSGDSGGSSSGSSDSGSKGGTSNGGGNGGGNSQNNSQGGQGGNGQDQSSHGGASGGNTGGGGSPGGNAEAVDEGGRATKNASGSGNSTPTSSNATSDQPNSSTSPDAAGSTSTGAPDVVVNVSSAHTSGDGQTGDSTSANSSQKGGSAGSHAGGNPTSTNGATANGGTGNGGNNGAIPSVTATHTDSSSNKGLSTTAIASIVSVLIILLLCLLVFILRRRFKARRSERRLRWWSRKNASPPRSAQATVGSGTASARSSFATTFDHGLSPHLTLTFDGSGLPEVPPMAEIRSSPNSSRPSTARGPVTLTPLLINVESERRRTSVHSAHSDSGEEGQYLVIHPSATLPRPRQDLLAPDTSTPTSLLTPMSVRPFSPSESFSFPKPPGKRTSEWSAGKDDDRSRPMSLKSGKLTINRKPVPTIENPFADPGGETNLSPFQENAEFAEVEPIQRPFQPTLDDEIAVGPGDRVRVVQPFNDGWAFVEKIVGNGQTQSGLIPIDCMRAENQDLPTFLAAKRVSSYSNIYLAI